MTSDALPLVQGLSIPAALDENGKTVQTQAAIQKDSRAESFFFMEIILSSEIGLISPFKISC